MRLVAMANENLSKDAALVERKGPKIGTEKNPSESDTKVALSQPKAVSPKPFELTDTAAAFGPIAVLVLSGTPDLRAGNASTSAGSQASVAGPELSEPAEAAELVILSDFCRLGNQAIAIAAESEVSSEDAMDMAITQEPFIWGFGAFWPPVLTAAMGSPEPPEAARSVIARVADHAAPEGIIMSCLDEALEWDQDVDVVASACRPSIHSLPTFRRMSLFQNMLQSWQLSRRLLQTRLKMVSWRLRLRAWQDVRRRRSSRIFRAMSSRLPRHRMIRKPPARTGRSPAWGLSLRGWVTRWSLRGEPSRHG